LVATGNVLTERSAPGKPQQSATAKSGTAQLAPGGGWTQMDLQGNVKLKEGEKSAQAEHALFLQTAQSATLTGRAVVSDGASETHAQRIIFLQSTGDVRAEGGVRTTDLSPKGNSPQFAVVPANLSSDTMRANTKTGHAVYSGHARLWQGDAVVEADSIELIKDTRELHATGNVRGVFPQMARKGAVLWHVSTGTMTYSDAESRAHLEQSVVAQSADQRIRAQSMDLFFTRTGGGSAKTGGAAQQISRAVGTGGVVVEQGGRRGTAERGEYTAADGKFILSGGNPTLFDALNGTTTGRELTFFLADDTIIVNSENGSRTVTKHRVER
jgi:lipopolysaccharide export system protein LptA